MHSAQPRSGGVSAPAATFTSDGLEGASGPGGAARGRDGAGGSSVVRMSAGSGHAEASGRLPAPGRRGDDAPPHGAGESRHLPPRVRRQRRAAALRRERLPALREVRGLGAGFFSPCVCGLQGGPGSLPVVQRQAGARHRHPRDGASTPQDTPSSVDARVSDSVEVPPRARFSAAVGSPRRLHSHALRLPAQDGPSAGHQAATSRSARGRPASSGSRWATSNPLASAGGAPSSRGFRYTRIPQCTRTTGRDSSVWRTMAPAGRSRSSGSRNFLTVASPTA